jgi:hypothetical protein
LCRNIRIMFKLCIHHFLFDCCVGLRLLPYSGGVAIFPGNVAGCSASIWNWMSTPLATTLTGKSEE